MLRSIQTHFQAFIKPTVTHTLIIIKYIYILFIFFGSFIVRITTYIRYLCKDISFAIMIIRGMAFNIGPKNLQNKLDVRHPMNE